MAGAQRYKDIFVFPISLRFVLFSCCVRLCLVVGFVCVGFLFRCILDLIGDLNGVLGRRWAEWCNLVCAPPRLRQGPVLGVFPKITLRGRSCRFCGLSVSFFLADARFFGTSVVSGLTGRILG